MLSSRSLQALACDRTNSKWAVKSSPSSLAAARSCSWAVRLSIASRKCSASRSLVCTLSQVCTHSQDGECRRTSGTRTSKDFQSEGLAESRFHLLHTLGMCLQAER